MGAARSYEFACVLSAPISTDGMSADYFLLPHDILDRAAACITTEVRGLPCRLEHHLNPRPAIEWKRV